MRNSSIFWMCQVLTWGGVSGARPLGPVKLGALRGVVGSNAAFAGILEDDTVPHRIGAEFGGLPLKPPNMSGWW